MIWPSLWRVFVNGVLAAVGLSLTACTHNATRTTVRSYQDGMEAALTVDRKAMEVQLSVRNLRKDAVGVFDEVSSAYIIWLRFRDRENHFIYLERTIFYGWASPSLARAEAIALPVTLTSLPPGAMLSGSKTIPELMAFLATPTTAPASVNRYEFQFQAMIHYDDPFLRKWIEVRTPWLELSQYP